MWVEIIGVAVVVVVVGEVKELHVVTAGTVVVVVVVAVAGEESLEVTLPQTPAHCGHTNDKEEGPATNGSVRVNWQSFGT